MKKITKLQLQLVCMFPIIISKYFERYCIHRQELVDIRMDRQGNPKPVYIEYVEYKTPFTGLHGVSEWTMQVLDIWGLI